MDELKIVELVAHRLHQGLPTYGPMDIDDDRDDLQEAVEEAVDLSIYLTKFLLRLKRMQSRKAEATPPRPVNEIEEDLERLARHGARREARDTASTLKCSRCGRRMGRTGIQETDGGPVCALCADSSLAGVQHRIEDYAERRRQEQMEGADE